MSDLSCELPSLSFPFILEPVLLLHAERSSGLPAEMYDMYCVSACLAS